MDSAALLKKIDQLPRLPKAVSELLEAVNNDKSTIKEISTKVSQDPLMSARVLRLANSSHYSRNREVGTIDEAVVRLGMQTLRTLVIASAVIGAVPKAESINLADFWGATFEVALYSQELAKNTMIPTDEAFTCGILHSIGDLLIASAEPHVAKLIAEAVAAGADKQDTEVKLLDFDAASIGALLAQSWRFTDKLAAGIANQYQPKGAKPYSELAGLMYMAKTLFHSWDDIEDDGITSWLSQQAVNAGLKMDMSGLAAKLMKVKGCGLEMGQQLA
ncbi:HDOD domain-containing protein [Shewanella sp. SR44-3]|uniref:HDOD domain-containing protein n=3 Tax=Shewanella TaxID=22 RepID=UPI0015FADA9F|nr:HDOD domain-containing protein [Shewanella sp. SR44-3]MBB1268529.1 HDOD domain-containing protein [Shewanella sp. SR44-3]